MLSDQNQIWQASLSLRRNHLCQISWRSHEGFRPRRGPKFAVFHSLRYTSLTLCRPTGPASDFLFYFFFSVTPFDKTCRPILTYNSSNGAAWPKEVPFGGSNDRNSNFGGLRAPNPQNLPRYREIPAKTAVSNNFLTARDRQNVVMEHK